MSRARALPRHTPAPRLPRRVSGPAPAPRVVPGRPRPTTPVRDTGAFAARVRALPDARLLDRLLRSRAWIWLLGIGLGGIVFMQVSLLGMNAGIAANVDRAATLEDANAALEQQISTLGSGDRVRAAAAKLGLVTPDAGSVTYLHTRRADPARAARNMTPPSATAQENLATDGQRTIDQTAAVAPATAAAPEPYATATPVATATP